MPEIRQEEKLYRNFNYQWCFFAASSVRSILFIEDNQDRANAAL